MLHISNFFDPYEIDGWKEVLRAVFICPKTFRNTKLRFDIRKYNIKFIENIN